MHADTTIKIAVIGLGNMGKNHLKHYADIETCTLVSVCDINPNLVRTYSEQYQCKGYSNLDTLLNSEKIDAMSLIAPTKHHYSMAKKILSKKIHLLIEKPIAETVEESNELIELANQNNLILTVGHIERFNPAVLALKKAVDAGELGQIVSIHAKRAGVFPPQIRDANVLIDLAVHDIDIISSLIGHQPKKIAGTKGRAHLTQREDYALYYLTYGTIEQPQTALVEVNWITPKRVRTLTLTGTKGYAELDYIAQEVNLYKSLPHKASEEPDHLTMPFSEASCLKIDKKPPLDSELRHFIDCIQHHRPPMVSAQQARDALKVSLAI